MYQELENKALAEFEEKFVEDRGRYVEPIFKDAVGSVGPIKNFLKSHLKEAYEAGVDKTIERFATGELLKSDDAQKFYDLAYEAGRKEGFEEAKRESYYGTSRAEILALADKIENRLKNIALERQQAIAEERERLRKWAEKHKTDSANLFCDAIEVNLLLQELTK
jgi:hypothetical protein